jgi:hypothetical protein
MTPILRIAAQMPALLSRWPSIWLLLRYERQMPRPAIERFTAFYSSIKAALVSQSGWISHRVDSIHKIRERHNDAAHFGSYRWFEGWIHAHHSWRSSLAIWACCTICPLVLATVVSAIAPTQATPTTNPSTTSVPSNDYAVLVGLAQMLAGAAGLLFAVIVFGLQFHGQRMESRSYLMRYVRMHEGLLPYAGFTLAVAVVNGMGAVLSNAGHTGVGAWLLVFDYVLVPAAILVCLWLLYRLSFLVSEDWWAVVRPGLVWELKQKLYEDEHYRQMMRGFEAEVQSCGLKYTSARDLFNLDPVRPARFCLKRPGRVVDVNSDALHGLAELLKTSGSDGEPIITLAPGDVTFHEDDTGTRSIRSALILQAARDSAGRLSLHTPGVPPIRQNKVRRLVRKTFRVGRLEQSDVFGDLRRFQESLSAEAASLSAGDVKGALAVDLELAKFLLAVERTDSTYSFYREHLPDPVGTAHWALAHRVCGTGSMDAISEVAWHAYRLMSLGISHNRADVYRNAGQMLEIIYAQRPAHLADRVSEVVLKRLSVLEQFALFRWHRSSFDASQTRSQMDVLVAALSTSLALIRIALETGGPQDAIRILRRLWKWDEGLYGDYRHVRTDEEPNVPAIMRQVYDLHSAVTLVIAAWCLYVCRTKASAQKAKEAFDTCVAELGGREDLLRVANAVSAQQNGCSLAACFGAEHWTVPLGDDLETPVLMYGPPDSWWRDGFLLLLLCRPSVADRDLPGEFFSDLSVPLGDVADIEARCRALCADDSVRALLGVDDIEGAIEALLTFVRKRRSKDKESEETAEEAD